MTASLLAYHSLTAAISPFTGMILKSRVKKGKEDPNRLQERQGFASRKRPAGKLIWMHGASIGESQVLLLLFEAMRKQKPDLQALITTQTLTSADLIARKNLDGLIHQMAPLDTPFAAERFLKHWHPDVAVFAEGDIWPNLITKLDKKRIPRLLVNARMTEKSFHGWMRYPQLATKLFGGFDHIIAANQKTADFLKRFYRKRVKMAGNVKYSAPPLSYDRDELAKLEPIIGRRNVIAAISTHPGEEELIAEATARLGAADRTPPLLIIAPRHPERGADIAARLRQQNEKLYLRSRDNTPTGRERIWICDTLGEVGLWTKLSDVVFLGGGLPGSETYGHNPIEPLKLKRHVVSFPEVTNFQKEFDDMTAAHAATLVDDVDELVSALRPHISEGTVIAPNLAKLAGYLEADDALNASRNAVLDALERGKKR